MARTIMYQTKKYIKISGKTITHPTISMGLQENALPIAKVAVIKAVLGKTKENQVIEKTIRPAPMAVQCAAVAMMKKKMANLPCVSATP